MDEEGNQVTIKVIPRPISLRQITTLQLKKCLRKGFQLYAIHVEESKEGKEPELQDYPILQNFADIFQEPPGIPPKREIDFSIDLVPGTIPSSKEPYRMSNPELKELHMQL